MNRSNAAGTWVLALAAGVASFAGYRYVKSNPEVLSFLRDEVEEPLETAPEEEPLDDSLPTLAFMREAEARIWPLYEETRLEPGGDHQDIQDLVRRVVARWEEFGQTEDYTEQEGQEAQMIALRAQFVGAKVVPGEFDDGFLALCKSVIDREPGSPAAAQADSLRILQRHTWDRALDPTIKGEFERFTRTYPGSPLGVALYSTAAAELARNGQTTSAKTLLKHGIKAYSGQPQAGQLVNQLVNQGLCPPPEPQITEETMRAHLTALSRVSGESSRSGSGKGKRR